MRRRIATRIVRTGGGPYTRAGGSVCPEHFRSQAEVGGPGCESDVKRQGIVVTGSNGEAEANVGAKKWECEARLQFTTKLAQQRRITGVSVPLCLLCRHYRSLNTPEKGCALHLAYVFRLGVV